MMIFKRCTAIGSLAYQKIRMMKCTFAMRGWRMVLLWIGTMKILTSKRTCWDVLHVATSGSWYFQQRQHLPFLAHNSNRHKRDMREIITIAFLSGVGSSLNTQYGGDPMSQIQHKCHVSSNIGYISWTVSTTCKPTSITAMDWKNWSNGHDFGIECWYANSSQNAA